MSDFGEGANGLVISTIGKEDLGDPQAYLLLVVLQLDVFLEVLETVFH